MSQDYELREPDVSLGELTSRLTNEFSELIRTHIQLAKEEIKTEAKTAGQGAGMLVAGAVAAHLTLIVLSLAAAWGLDAVMPTGLAFLIVGVVWGVVTAVLLMIGRKRLQHVEPTPRATMQELEEDKQWLKKQR